MFTITLRDYQTRAVEDIRAAYRAGFRAPLLVMPTGSGKTVVFSYITYHASLKKNRVLILVHRQELVEQCSRALGAYGLPHGVIMAGYPTTKHPVQVATVQTLVRRLDHYPVPPTLIVSDEFHHSSAASWRKVFQHFKDSLLLGCTATPSRLDGRGLGRSCGGYSDILIQGPNIQELIRDGWISPPVVYAPPVGIDLNGVHKRAGDYDRGELETRIDKKRIVGNVIDHYKRICPGQRAMAFCVTVKHAERVAEEFNLAGIPAASIDGTLADSVRKARLDALTDCRIKVLTSCEIVNEGIDIPVVSVAILLRPTYSLGLFLQQVGRTLRPFPGKKCTTVLDHVGNCFRHGLPDDIREWTLEGEYTRKKKEKDEKVLRFHTCQKCFAIFALYLKACPQCGTEYKLTRTEIETVDGELQELKRELIQKSKKAELWKAKTMDELKAVGERRGYKYPRLWAEHIIKARERKHASMDYQQRAPAMA